MPTKKRSLLFIAVRVVVLVYLGFVVLLAGCQRRYIYYPQKAGEERTLSEAKRYGLEPWRDSDGNLIGWQAPAPVGSGPVRTAGVFHGNAGMAAHRAYYAEGLQAVAGETRWAVHILEYPGYGSRGGKPSESVFYEAARAALEERFAAGDASVFLIGESLGSGVAAKMAGEFSDRVEGVLLVTPFTTLADVAARHFPFFPVRLLLRDRYDNVVALQDYEGPVAVLLVERDEVIPVELGKRLFESYSGPKKLWIQEGRNHNSLDLTQESVWWKEVSDFLTER